MRLNATLPTMAPESQTHPIPDGQLLTGHVVEWGELLGALAERRGLTVLVADPLSGTSDLLAAALTENAQPHLLVDARRCADALDLAMAIGDAAVAALAPDANAWWLGSASPSSTAGLRVWRSLSEHGVDVDDLRHGGGRGPQRLREALDLTTTLAAGPVILAIDHLGTMLANLRTMPAREILGELRAARQRASDLDLVLVDHPRGPVSDALGDTEHPLYHAGERLRLPRPQPGRFIDDLAITKPLVDTSVGLLRAAAEIAAGVPALTWQIVALAPSEGDDAARAAAGWQTLRRANATSVRQQWDLLRRVHPSAQAIVSAMSLDLKPHSLPLASKTVDDALNRLRDVGLAWQPAERSWVVADPLLVAYAREHAPPWALRRRSYARAASTRDEGDRVTT